MIRKDEVRLSTCSLYISRLCDNLYDGARCVDVTHVRHGTLEGDPRKLHRTQFSAEAVGEMYKESRPSAG